MLAWMQSGVACLFLHPGALWVEPVVVLVMYQWDYNGPPPTQRVSGWEQDGVNSCDIRTTSQSQHTVAVFPKCLLANVWMFEFSFLSRPIEIESDALWPRAFWETQGGSHDVGSRESISQSALALPPSVLRSCYWLEELSTHQTQR